MVIVRKFRSFQKDYDILPFKVQEQVEKTLLLLMENPRHPSLQVKKIQGCADLWEARIDLKRRITFHWFDKLLALRRIGVHDIVNKEAKQGR